MLQDDTQFYIAQGRTQSAQCGKMAVISVEKYGYEI